MKRLSLLAGLVVALALVASAADRPLKPDDAPRHMTLPDGFKATLFAGEPDVLQPIAFTFDDRGRMWVVECLTYPQWTSEKEGNDRVLILEDTDGDGHFDKRTVFFDKGANLTSIEVGFGGVWLCATPNLIFIPDRNGDDKPDGPPEVVLDGWDLKAKHNVFNGLIWGPDGWLYGCNGILSNSRVGKPNTPDDRRVSLNCGVWRYHPRTQVFEAVAHGTTNPWGLDFDDLGEMFITNCVIHHLWHVVPGAHFQRMFGQDINPNSYSLMTSCADHIHWGGGAWTDSRGGKGAHSVAGGGHAHSGAMVYLGDNWPEEYRNGLFTCNIHGNRVNHDTLNRQGSGYVAKHAKDFLLANDEWFRGIAVHSGPDGAGYVTDWTDTGECHNYVTVDRTNGRIYKVVHGEPKRFTEDFAKLSDAELVKKQLHKNDWHVRHARRLLQERADAGKLSADTHKQLRAMLADQPDVTRKLRALWALHATGGLDEKQLLALCDSKHEELRAWAVRLAVDEKKPGEAMRAKMAELAANEESPFVRLHLASALQWMPVEQRWGIAEGLAQHAKDAADPNLPLMVWYGIEPLAPADTDRAVKLIATAEIPLVRQYLARRIASLRAKGGESLPGLTPLVLLLGEVENAPVQADVLHGIEEALTGRRDAPLPKGWGSVYPKLAKSGAGEVRDRARALAVVFGDETVLTELRKALTDASRPADARREALRALVFKQKADIVPVLHDLLKDRDVRGAAIVGLAAFSDEATPKKILEQYAGFTDGEKSDAIQTLASRPKWALVLMDAIEKNTIKRQDVTPFTVRQLQGLKDKKLNEKIASVWGAVRPSSEEKKALAKKFKSTMTPDYLKKADVSNGRALFQKHCAACHRLFDDGNTIGPELTGSQRNNLDYVLENVLDPSAVVPREYQVTRIELKNGRFLDGIIKMENDVGLTLQTQNEVVVVPKKDIEERTVSPVSMMPEGLLDKLPQAEARDLIAYLASPSQVPLPRK